MKQKGFTLIELLVVVAIIGILAAFEVMVNNPAIANLIRENKIEQLISVMQTAQVEGMTTMEKSIENLVGTNQINL